MARIEDRLAGGSSDVPWISDQPDELRIRESGENSIHMMDHERALATPTSFANLLLMPLIDRDENAEKIHWLRRRGDRFHIRKALPGMDMVFEEPEHILG
jgi:hypothetical protein